MFPLFAHQGGWDEVLLVAIPLGLIAGLLWIANKRVNTQLEEAERAGNEGDASQTNTGQADKGQSVPKNP